MIPLSATVIAPGAETIGGLPTTDVMYVFVAVANDPLKATVLLAQLLNRAQLQAELFRGPVDGADDSDSGLFYSSEVRIRCSALVVGYDRHQTR